MEISTTLLVALMFVTILTFGIAGLLQAVAGSLAQVTSVRNLGLRDSWTLLLLLAYLSMFWHTPAIIGGGDWGFGGFLFVLAGPILMFFTTSMLLSTNVAEEWTRARAVVGPAARRFFAFFGFVQAWILAMDYLLGRGFTGSSFFTAALLATGVLLATVGAQWLRAATALVWVLYVGAMVLRGMRVII